MSSIQTQQLFTSHVVLRFARNLFRRGLRRKLVCLVLLLNILIWPATDLTVRALPTLGRMAVSLATGSLRNISVIAKSLFRSASAAGQQETPEQRLARVARIRISPLKYVGYQQQQVTLTALATDLAGQTVLGIKFDWESSHPSRVEIDDAGQATFHLPGLVFLTCRAGAAQASAPVLVRPGQRPLQTDAQWLADQNSLNGDGTVRIGSNVSNPDENLVDSLMDRLMPAAHAQSCGAGGDGGDSVYDEIWSEPRNLLGSPHNRAAEPTRMGLVLPEGSNFNFAVPIVSLGGRGIGSNLMLYYNSRIWSRHGNAVTFNAVNGWPYAGFSLGFGRVVTYGADPSVSYLLIDPDGTRHRLGVAPSSGTNTLETSDGTHIQYVGNASYGELRYPDGTRVSIVLLNNRLLPTQITDRNGNYVQVAYKSFFPWNQAIDYVRDTLGRYIQFNYDGCSSLVSITAPAFGSGTRTLAQFDYQSRSLTYSFSGLSVENASYGQTLNTLRHVYFPATQSGYSFSYSDYGMIYNASLRRQMSIDQFGAISNGVESATTSFNYPTSGGTVLTDAPAFSQRTESPGGTYSYNTNTGSQTIIFTITRPDASQMLLTRSTNTGSTDNGLLVQSEVKSGSSSLAKNVFAYIADPFGSPQAQSVTSYDDMGTPTKVDFDYDRTGAVTNRREYGFQISGAWQVRRRTQFIYKSDPSYFTANLWRLVSSVFVYDAQLNTYDGDDILVAQTNYTYDNYSAMGGMLDYWNASWAPGHVSSYNTTKTVRGNVTGTTEYKVVFGGTITRLAKFDVFGNLVKAQVTCCNQKNYTFDINNYWSKPVQLTDGDPTGVHLTGTAAYDFNTSLVTSQTDANNLTTSFSYDSALRLQQKTLPTGATVTTTYNDAALTASTTVNYVEAGQNRSIATSGVYNGWGQATQRVDAASNLVNIGYDSMQRVCSQTNPFAQGGQPGPSTTYSYDGLGRVRVTTLPDTVNTIQYTYSGTTRTITDQVNRQIKQEQDGLARIVKVTEKDANGQLTQETNYTYDVVDNLTQVNQGGQTRSYKYDALSRLLFERIPEQSATINDGTGALWSSKYTWTDFHAISTKQDARGAVVSYGYDVLNRLTSVSYDTSNAPGVATTPNVTYNYDTSSYSSTKGLLLSVGVGSGYSESYGYDSFNRVSSVTHAIDGINYSTSYQYNTINQQTQLTYPSTRVINLSHDSNARVTSIADASTGNYVSGIGYNSAEQVTAWTLGNSVVEGFGYDTDRLQMTSQSATRGGNTLLSLNYSYSALAGQNGAGSTAGNAAQLMSVSGTINGAAESAGYAYDLQGRLATSSQTSNGASAQRRYAYDRWGNRTAAWDAVSGGNQIQTVTLQQSGGVPTNQIATVNAVGFSYDAAGNVTNDGSHSYTYDAENRVVSIDGGAAQYGYDHRNWRVKKIASGATTHYVWEGGQVLAEHNGAGGNLVDYVYAGGKMIAKVASGSTQYFISDRLSVRMTVDSSGNVIGRQAHLAFGEDFAESGIQEKHHFTSYERDGESGLDYGVNRYYGRSPGRFNSVDPLRGSVTNPQSLNRYTYGANDPINQVDPDGRFFIAPLFNIGAIFNVGSLGEVTVTAGPDFIFADISLGPSLIPPFFFGGPIPVPELPRSEPVEPEPEPEKSQQDIVNDAVYRTRQALENSDKCKKLIGGDIGASAVVDYFGNLSSSGAIHPGVDPRTGVPAQMFPSQPPEIRVYPLFFNRINPTTGNVLPSLRGAGEGSRFPNINDQPTYQTLVILHELAHATGALKHGATTKEEAKFNARIWRDCLK